MEALLTTLQVLVEHNVVPRFFKPCLVPHCLKENVEKELDHLVDMKIITPVSFSDWAAPIVLVIKQDGTTRLCCDYKVTVNQAAMTESYPLPRIKDLLTALSGGKILTKLDLSHGYSNYCCMKILRSIQLLIPTEVCLNIVVYCLEFCRPQPFFKD